MELLERQAAYACRGQLDGEWQTIELTADVGGDREIRSREVERGVGGAGSIEEQANGGRVVPADGQGPDLPHLLTVHRESFAAGSEDVDRARAPDDPLSERGCPGEHVLTVVEDHESLTMREMVEQQGIEGPERLLAQPETRRHGTGDVFGPFDYREITHVDAVGIATADLGRELQRQPRLAHSARSPERDQPDLTEETGGLAKVVVAAEEAADRARHIGRPTRPAAPSLRASERVLEDLALESPQGG